MRILICSMTALAMASLLLGCHPLTHSIGHYEGTLLQRNAAVTQVPVSADLTIGENSGGVDLLVSNLDHSTRYHFRFEQSVFLKKRLNVQEPKLYPDGLELSESQNCYQNSNGSEKIRFCVEDESLLLEIGKEGAAPEMSLALERFASSVIPDREVPQSYTLDEAVKRALHMEFNTRIEFQHVMQARSLANGAYLNLLPHLSMNSIPPLGVKDISGMIQGVGDLAPFLLPSRWFIAREAASRSKAENAAFLIMKADAVTQVQGLATGLHRDQNIEKLYASALVLAKKIRDSIAARESLGQYAQGTTDDMNSVVTSMEADSIVFSLLIEEEDTALAQAMGFVNPKAVTGLVFEPDATVAISTERLNYDELAPLALARAFELRQMDDLIEMARDTKKERLFDWMDVSSDPSFGLGFGLGSVLKVARSQIDEMLIRRQQLQSLILQRVDNLVLEHNQALTQLTLAEQGLVLQEKRLSRMKKMVEFGTNVDMFGLIAVFQDYLRTGISRENALAEHQITRFKVDRFSLMGAYSELRI